MTIKSYQALLATRFKTAGLDQAKLETDILLSNILKQNKTFLIAHPDKQIPNYKLNELSVLVNKRLKGIPLAYILHNKEFYGKNYYVNQNVLIPRPETEHLVEAALDSLNECGHTPIKIVEIGSGSGCIPISLILNTKSKLQIRSYDVSRKAISIAHFNALNLLNQTQRKQLSFIQKDVFKSELDYDYSIFISNPPYISLAEYNDLDPTIKNNEPKKALLGGNSGLIFYEKVAQIIAAAPRDRKRIYLLELNANLEKQIREIYRLCKYTIYNDYAGLPRVIKIIQ